MLASERHRASEGQNSIRDELRPWRELQAAVAKAKVPAAARRISIKPFHSTAVQTLWSAGAGMLNQRVLYSSAETDSQVIRQSLVWAYLEEATVAPHSGRRSRSN